MPFPLFYQKCQEMKRGNRVFGAVSVLRTISSFGAIFAFRTISRGIRVRWLRIRQAKGVRFTVIQEFPVPIFTDKSSI